MLNLFNYNNSSISIKARVTANAKQERVKKIVSDDGSVVYKIYVTVPAEDGKANRAVIAMIAKLFMVPKSHVAIKLGLYNKDKIINVILRNDKINN